VCVRDLTVTLFYRLLWATQTAWRSVMASTWRRCRWLYSARHTISSYIWNIHWLSAM